VHAPNTISVDKLVRLIGTPKSPTLVDVRAQDEFDADPRLIPSSRHLTFEKLEVWSEVFGSHPVVVICQKGASASQGVAAWLRDKGVPAEVLEGGFQAWRKAELPLVPVHKLPPVDGQGRTVWVTRARQTPDRIACPWPLAGEQDSMT
jgi:rhodanese-related sulfurtransferase